MGEATYYLKARFASEEAAQEAVTKASEMFARICLCQARWQNTRHGGKEADDQLRAEFPDVFDALKIDKPEKYDGSLNYLSGLLDAPDDRHDGQVFSDGDKFCASGTVWHFAQWDNLEEWLKSIGAIETAYISDEYIDPWNSCRLASE